MFYLSIYLVEPFLLRCVFLRFLSGAEEFMCVAASGVSHGCHKLPGQDYHYDFVEIGTSNYHTFTQAQGAQGAIVGA